ncbi:MAG: hypothetical protein ACI8S6_003088 [Myxococcota bacterium]|jgi:hypothetical protein
MEWSILIANDNSPGGEMSIQEELVWDEGEYHPRRDTDTILSTWEDEATATAPIIKPTRSPQIWLGMAVGVLSSLLIARIITGTLTDSDIELVADYNGVVAPMILPFEGLLPSPGLGIEPAPLLALASVWLMYALLSSFFRAIEGPRPTVKGP